MKYKVGDRVRIRKDLKDDERYGRNYADEDMEEMAGQIVTITYENNNHYEIKEDENEHWWTDEMFEGYVKPTKEELFAMPLGTIIKTDEEEQNIFVKVGKEDFCNNNCDHIEIDDVNDDLSIRANFYCTKILEIQEPTYNTIYKYETEVKEMTISEIEKELGYPIKVVKEEE